MITNTSSVFLLFSLRAYKALVIVLSSFLSFSVYFLAFFFPIRTARLFYLLPSFLSFLLSLEREPLEKSVFPVHFPFLYLLSASLSRTARLFCLSLFCLLSFLSCLLSLEREPLENSFLSVYFPFFPFFFPLSASLL